MLRLSVYSLVCFCAAVVLSATATPTNAQVIASEGFAYADTTSDGANDLTTVGNGGVGWTNNWFNDGNGINFQVNADEQAHAPVIDTTQRNVRQLSSPLGNVTETIYIRVDLLDQDPDDSDRRDVAGIALQSFVDSSLVVPSAGFEEVFFGTRDSFARLAAGGNNDDAAPGTTGGDDTLLLKIDFDATPGAIDTLTGWTFDSPNSFDPLGSSMMTGAKDFTFNGIRIVKNNADHFVNIDNLIVGRSLADVGVTAVPEPASLVLIAMAGLIGCTRLR